VPGVMVAPMRRLVSAVVRSPIRFAGVAYLLVRWAQVAGVEPARFPDSTGWTTLDLWGSNDRFWPIPLVFGLAGSDTVRVLAHVVLGAAAWTWLASSVSAMTKWPRTAMLAVFAVGLAPQVTRWDLAILGESLSITALVALIAASVRLARGASGPLPWFAMLVVFGLMRPTHLVVLAPVAAWFTVSAVRSRGARRALPALLLIAATIWGVALVRGNDATSRLNIYTVIANDVIVDDARFAWWVERGMPAPDGLRDAAGYDFAGDLPPDLAAIVALPAGQQPPAVVRAGGTELAEWVRNNGTVVQARWVLSHPRDAWRSVSSRAHQVLSPPNDDFLPLDVRGLPVRAVFADWRVWVAAWLAGSLAAFVRGAKRREGRMLVLSGFALVALLVVTMNFSGIEHQRHGAAVAVGLRVLGLVGLAAVVPGGRLSADARDADEPGARKRRGASPRPGRGRTSRSTRRGTRE